jgi:predicted glycosyltransferase
LVSLRSQIIQAAVSIFNPAVVIVDKKPRGIADELQLTLEHIHHHMPETEVVLLLRDILDDPEVTQRIWVKNHYFDSIERYYHSILVMGSKKVFDVCKEYCFPKNIVQKVQFCGYINRNHISDKATVPLLFSDTPKPRVLVTVGGGEDGFVPLNHYIKGLTQDGRDEAISTLIVTGPEMSQHQRQEIKNRVQPIKNTRVIEFIPDLNVHMQEADLIVSMAGYNTIVELLALNKSTIAIPRIEPVKEQLIRANCMDKLGLLKCLHPHDLSPESLMKEVFTQLDEPVNGNGARVKATEKINFNGLMTVSRTIGTMLTGNNKHKISFKSPMNTALKLKNKPMVESCSAFS